MAVEYKDYYKILGVDKKATEKEIKSAYRKLARKYHPDVNPGDKAAEQKFKDINEAQAVLTDADKRKQYDALGPDWQKRFQGGFRPGGNTYTYTQGGNAADFSDFFETLFGQRGSGAGTPGGFDFDLGSIFNRGRGKRDEPSQSGSDLEQPIDVSLREAFEGGERSLTLQTAETCPTCGGTGLQNNDLCPTCHGNGSVPKVDRITVKIPRGVREGSKIRLPGKGNPGMNRGRPGDLYLVVHLLSDPQVQRDGDDLRTEVSVPLTKLVLGGEVDVPTMTGRVKMRVPAGSQNGRTMRLTGQGMPQLKSDKRGDLYVRLNALLPTQLSEEQRGLFQQLEQAGV